MRLKEAAIRLLENFEAAAAAAFDQLADLGAKRLALQTSGDRAACRPSIFGSPFDRRRMAAADSRRERRTARIVAAIAAAEKGRRCGRRRRRRPRRAARLAAHRRARWSPELAAASGLPAVATRKCRRQTRT